MVEQLPPAALPEKLAEAQLAELRELRQRFYSYLQNIMPPQQFDLARVWRETRDLPELYQQLAEMKHCLDSFRPFNPAMLANLYQQEDVEFTYESNRIEGSTLTLAETDTIINKGEGVAGKPTREIVEAINHKKAIDYVRELACNQVALAEALLLTLHKTLMQGILDEAEAGFYRRRAVRIAQSQHVCPNFLRVPELMSQLFIDYDNLAKTANPVQLASWLHQHFVNIHPFVDGNGRTARLLMNYVLQVHGYPTSIIASNDPLRQSYYDALEHFHTKGGDSQPFDLVVATYAKQALSKYLLFFAEDDTADSEGKGYAFFKRIGLA